MSERDRSQLERIHYEYIRAVDDGEPESLANLFAPNGTFALGDRSFEGREEIREFLESSAANRPAAYQHLATNPIITVEGDEATARWSYVLLKADDPDHGDGEWAMGTHDVEYGKHGGEWKMDRLTATRTYTGDV
ncbi:nuclear transport factor 2 family protein [Halorarum halobium]|uniref:nuclear transport factor 2 family protein n=1 Tax=Halorarum halobium TaxID=3075121 RepID=UPI0028A89717|nr:nuclear transport factor 2 family protein [Halobaculum sp. XH14]